MDNAGSPICGYCEAPMPVAAILVASISVRKGEELGRFEHGSTIIVLAPAHFKIAENMEGARVRAGERCCASPPARLVCSGKVAYIDVIDSKLREAGWHGRRC